MGKRRILLHQGANDKSERFADHGIVSFWTSNIRDRSNTIPSRRPNATPQVAHIHLLLLNGYVDEQFIRHFRSQH